MQNEVMSLLTMNKKIGRIAVSGNQANSSNELT